MRPCATRAHTALTCAMWVAYNTGRRGAGVHGTGQSAHDAGRRSAGVRGRRRGVCAARVCTTRECARRARARETAKRAPTRRRVLLAPPRARWRGRELPVCFSSAPATYALSWNGGASRARPWARPAGLVGRRRGGRGNGGHGHERARARRPCATLTRAPTRPPPSSRVQHVRVHCSKQGQHFARGGGRAAHRSAQRRRARWRL
jgi:hypothetical protein